MNLEPISSDSGEISTAVLTPGQFMDLSREIFARGFNLRFRARGCSMWPFVLNGDVVTVTAAKADDICAGDIALYAFAEKMVLHRILRRTERGGCHVFIARGDSGSARYETVEPGLVVGKIIAVTRGNRERALGRRLDRWSGIVVSELAMIAGRASRFIRRLCGSANR